MSIPRHYQPTRICALIAGFFAIIATTFSAEIPAAKPAKQLPLPGELFTVRGCPAFLITTNTTGSAKPWVWYAPTLLPYPGREEKWMFEQFLASGISIAGIDVGESYGSPEGNDLFNSFHAEMTRRGYSEKPVLLGRSRGGLMLLSWAADNPWKVAGFAGIYPVCNLASYPGLAKAAAAYQLSSEELQAGLARYNPVDRLQSLARARVPLFAIHGDQDQLVPLEANSGLAKERYTQCGGSMELIVSPGQGHNMWTGFFQSPDLVRFVKAHAEPLQVTEPLDYQVVQRHSRNSGAIPIKGTFKAAKGTILEARLVVQGKPQKWRRVRVSSRGTFTKRLSVQAGGWHRLEIRARADQKIISEHVVERVAVGEVFVIAGQSNAANHGEEKQQTRTRLVSTFDGQQWRLADDPQPGASGNGGSFMPPFGDAIAEKFNVPVGIVACGVGATSVREWLPAGARFPNPPTLLGNVRRSANGEWESDGRVYQRFVERMKSLGPSGFRAVLWHQGESDANQADAPRTLPGGLYREYLENLIHASRKALDWKVPWFVAQASYHNPNDQGSADLRTAQAALWQKRIALEGPDTDALKGSMRDSGGQGVHFSGAGLREHGALWADKVGPWLTRQLK